MTLEEFKRTMTTGEIFGRERFPRKHQEVEEMETVACDRFEHDARQWKRQSRENE